ncbi:hypothetical protein J2Z21_009409 [Streptomyces griseochromogenes]|uniref:Uncharacterized protein n=1 Tax=Streptomyces griseochromogenes TaxID=68214 RepID=A0A1B1AZ75_9ACTN|nr:hypothetical protein [Streptomyces griseochromogenes]ANP51884.1 hypothetical protein AVL59_21990 [Streptomyces griseochromogenes]MBP2056391.1 hypothetical protein [Streptomyces griseochromogenes]
MNTAHSLILAGQLNDLGDGWINMFKEWATKGLQAGLVCLVVVIMIQKFSLKAGIGALILMVIALGLYNSRNDLANMFQDEVKHPAKGAPAVPGIVQSDLPASRDHSPGGGGWL